MCCCGDPDHVATLNKRNWKKVELTRMGVMTWMMHYTGYFVTFDTYRKLTAEEAARMASESELERKLREASTAVQDMELYRYIPRMTRTLHSPCG